MLAQWRTNNSYDTVLILDDEGRVKTQFRDNEADSIHNLLVNPGRFADWKGNAPSSMAPDDYGALVMERDDMDGTTNIPDPDLFCHLLALWFAH